MVNPHDAVYDTTHEALHESGEDAIDTIDIDALHDYSREPRLRDMPRTIWNAPRIILLGLIRFYQMTLSRSIPQDTCRFYPSCSHYGYQAIYKYGAFKGLLMAAWRVIRCNPFNRGGYDPVL